MTFLARSTPTVLTSNMDGSSSWDNDIPSWRIATPGTGAIHTINRKGILQTQTLHAAGPKANHRTGVAAFGKTDRNNHTKRMRKLHRKRRLCFSQNLKGSRTCGLGWLVLTGPSRQGAGKSARRSARLTKTGYLFPLAILVASGCPRKASIDQMPRNGPMASTLNAHRHPPANSAICGRSQTATMVMAKPTPI